jgi:phage virion morphogenesis protein
MADPLQQLEDWAAPLLAQLQPAQQRALVRQVARELRASQAQRIARQQNPDGSAFEARRPQPGNRPQATTKARAMFGKLRQARHLRLLPDPAGAAVGFTGRAARIATVHQQGLRDRVRPGGPEVQYPARQLLGFTAADVDRVRTTLLAALAG